MKYVLLFFVICTYVVCAVCWWTEALNLLNGDTMSVFIGLAMLAFTLALTAYIAFISTKTALRNLAAKGSILLVLLLGGCGCDRVDVGHVGLKIQMAGSNRGVQDIPLVSGWVFYNPMTERVLEYPVYTQTTSWAANNATNEEISFNSKEGLAIQGDISLSYQLAEDHAPHFYVKFRTQDLASFTHGYLRNVARDQFNEVAGTYAIEDLYGPKKEEFIQAVKLRVNKEMEPFGITVGQFGFIGAPRLPDNVSKAINNKIASTQAAIQLENELRGATASAKKVVAAAQGAADARIAQAQGEATSKVLLAESEAKANNLIAASISPNVLEWKRLAVSQNVVARWNGVRPQVEAGGQGMILSLPALK